MSDDNEITLADFGFAIEESQLNQEDALICGTAGYFAPEILSGKSYSNKSDIFSVGCLLYILMTRRSLFTGVNQREILIQNKRCALPSDFNKSISSYSPILRDFLRLLLDQNHITRPSTEEALAHCLFDEIRDGIKKSLELNSPVNEATESYQFNVSLTKQIH